MGLFKGKTLEGGRPESLIQFCLGISLKRLLSFTSLFKCAGHHKASWSKGLFFGEVKFIFKIIRPWCWGSLKAGGEGEDRGWDGWMASPTRWTWVWASSGRWWRTGKPGVLQSMGLQRIGHDLVTTTMNYKIYSSFLAVCCPGPSVSL